MGRFVTFINAGPALSIDFTRNLYHHNVPVLSLSCSGCLLPIHIAGTVTITGTKMSSKCTNLNPVHIGSQIYTSRKRTMPCRIRDNPISSSDSFFSISSLEAASIRPSPVWEVPPLSFSERATNTAGERAVVPTAANSIVRPYLGRGGWENGLCECCFVDAPKRRSEDCECGGRWVN